MKLTTKVSAPPKVIWGVASSPAGKLLVGVTEKNEICRVSFLRKNKPQDIVSEWQAEWPRTHFVSGAKLEKMGAKPIMLVGTPFQQSVWKAMAKIPTGSVTTYGEIARHIGKPKASRAVGAACGANPVAYLVPCHRVIAANGNLGGFTGGLDIKKLLLKVEGFRGVKR